MKFAAIDFETANKDPNSACAVGIVRVENKQIIKQKYSLICPPSNNFEFTHIHGLTWKDVCQSPTFNVIWTSIQEIITGVDFLVAHNAKFDRQVLLSCCKQNKIYLDNIQFICTVKIARQVWGLCPAKLPDVCKHLKIQLNHHQALSDAIACSQILIKTQELLGDDIVYESFLID